MSQFQMPSTQAAVPGRVAGLSRSRAGSSSPPAEASGVTLEPMNQSFSKVYARANQCKCGKPWKTNDFPNKMIHQWLGYPKYVCMITGGYIVKILFTLFTSLGQMGWFQPGDLSKLGSEKLGVLAIQQGGCPIINLYHQRNHRIISG